jgi:hypothetical protein
MRRPSYSVEKIPVSIGGERGRARTCNRQLRRLMLYPIELLARAVFLSIVAGKPGSREWTTENRAGLFANPS